MRLSTFCGLHRDMEHIVSWGTDMYMFKNAASHVQQKAENLRYCCFGLKCKNGKTAKNLHEAIHRLHSWPWDTTCTKFQFCKMSPNHPITLQGNPIQPLKIHLQQILIMIWILLEMIEMPIGVPWITVSRHMTFTQVELIYISSMNCSKNSPDYILL